MKIALVYPRVFSQVRSFFPPLGIISLATVLKAKGYAVKIMDSSFQQNLNKLKQELKSYAPDITGISITTDLYPAAREICCLAKKIDCLTILGGPHATLFAAEILKECKEVDMVIKGEAEHTCAEFLTKYQEGKRTQFNIAGIVYRKNGSIVENSSREWMQNLDTLPLPDRELLPNYKTYSASGFTGVIFTRGCPYNCKFCQPVLNKVAGTFRYRSAVTIAEELKLLYYKYKNNLFHIDDDLFTLKKDLIRDIIMELKKRNLLGKIKFIVLSRVDSFNKELALLLKELGTCYLLFGVESGSQMILDSLDKKITVPQIKNAFSLAKSYKFRTHAFIMLGSPLETRETLCATEHLIEEIKPDSIFFSLFVPGLKTYFYEELKNKNLLNIKSYEHLSFYSWQEKELPIKSDKLSYKEIVAFKNRILRKRCAQFILVNIIEAIRDFLEHRSIKHLVFRARFYIKKSCFAG